MASSSARPKLSVVGPDQGAPSNDVLRLSAVRLRREGVQMLEIDVSGLGLGGDQAHITQALTFAINEIRHSDGSRTLSDIAGRTCVVAQRHPALGSILVGDRFALTATCGQNAFVLHWAVRGIHSGGSPELVAIDG